MKSNEVRKDESRHYILEHNNPEYFFIGAVRGVLMWALKNPADFEPGLFRIQELVNFMDERMKNDKANIDARIEEARKSSGGGGEKESETSNGVANLSQVWVA